jgi:DnaJ-class molecular chaperone
MKQPPQIEVEWVECPMCNGRGVCKTPSGLNEQRCAMCSGKKRVMVRAKKGGK